MQSPPKKSRRGLWIVLALLVVLGVPCLIGVMAAIAIPAYHDYVTRAKTAEAARNLENIYEGAVTYYTQERAGQGGAMLTGCTVGSAITPNAPSASKTLLGPLPPEFGELGFTPSDPVYYQYEIVGVAGCAHPPSSAVYTFRAHGDLDGDGTQSLFELAVGSDANGDLYRAPHLYITNELE